VTALVSTSNAWPHVAGAPRFAERGAALYALPANLPLLRRLAAANGSELDGAAAIGADTRLGSGANALRVFPAAGPATRRQAFVYVAGPKLLYASDAVQLDAGGAIAGYGSQAAADIVTAACREGLEVDRVFAMHAAPIAWADFVARAGFDPETPCG
jgi:hypothetical protein